MTENRRERWRSRPFVVDSLLAVQVFAGHVPIMLWANPRMGLLDWPVLLNLAACASLVLHRRFPLAVLCATIAVADFVTWTGLVAFGVNIVSILVPLYTVCTACGPAGRSC